MREYNHHTNTNTLSISTIDISKAAPGRPKYLVISTLNHHTMKRIKISNVAIIVIFTGAILLGILSNKSGCRLAVHHVKERITAISN